MTNREKFNLWLETFIEEKSIPNKTFKINYADAIHFMDSEQVIDLIRKAPINEQEEIKDILVKIDFKNGDVNHFLEYLAKSYIQLNF